MAGSPTTILAGLGVRQRRLKGGASPDRISALADGGAAKSPFGNICRSESRVVSQLNQPKIELDAEPSYFRQTGDALHDFAFTAP